MVDEFERERTSSAPSSKKMCKRLMKRNKLSFTTQFLSIITMINIEIVEKKATAKHGS
jgi:hypothetical protein